MPRRCHGDQPKVGCAITFGYGAPAVLGIVAKDLVFARFWSFVRFIQGHPNQGLLKPKNGKGEHLHG
jgi:hypothetical protein